MSTTTTVTSTKTTTWGPLKYPAAITLNGSLKLRAASAPEGKTFLATTSFPELDEKGYTVVPHVLSEERAAYYVNEMYTWLESFGTGFKASDRSTWHVKNMPKFDKGGLYHRFGAGHEQFTWDIRSEPAVVDVFAKIWGTNELIVSYDSVNVSLPFPPEELEDGRGMPWPHCDQSPARRFRHCIQGIVNLFENGPNDGGLMVLNGSLPLFETFFSTHPELEPTDGWPDIDWFGHASEHLQWFYDRGCTWKKVEAGPGDVILWDSRTIHYGDAARGNRPRVATYVCYKPAKDMTPDKLASKKECFENAWGTSHDPLDFRIVNAKSRNWPMDEGEPTRPRAEPILSHRAKQLAGLVPY